MTLIAILSFTAYSSEIQALKLKLEKVNYFSVGMNSFIRHQNKGEKTHNAILPTDNPKEIFIKIIKNSESTNEAKLYAACSLHYLKGENIDLFFNKHEKRGDVSILRGDILTKRNFNDALNSVITNGCDTN